MCGDRVCCPCNFVKQRLLRQCVGQDAIEALVDEAGATARDIDELADQVGIDACDEVVEVEVDVFDRRSQLRGVVIAEIGRVEIVQVSPRHDERAT